MILFASLGSGSSGNAVLVEMKNKTFMIDCGLPLDALENRMKALKNPPAKIDLLLLTHEHGDHVAGVASLIKKYKMPLAASPKCLYRMQTRLFFDRKGLSFLPITANTPFFWQDVEIMPFAVPHDAADPVQYTFYDGDKTFAHLSDCGSITPSIEASLQGCDGLFLECNHDPLLLQQGPYSARLKKRIASDVGHLANDKAAKLLQRIDCKNLQHIVAAHVSEVNNTALHVQEALASALGCSLDWIGVAPRTDILDWREIR